MASMHVSTIRFREFRNISEAAIDPEQGLNIIWGNNAQGKTNFLEGIYLLGNGKSFRSAQNNQLIRHGSLRTSIVAEIRSNQVTNKIDLTIDEGTKAIALNGKTISSIDEIVAVNRQIIFSPEDVGIAKGAPAGRRNLLDRAVFLSETGYLRLVQNYNRILKQRNRLLREGKKKDRIQPWSESLVETGARIRLSRHRFRRDFEPYLRETYARLSAGREEASLHLPNDPSSFEEAKAALTDELQKVAPREERIGTTLAGPHRDDPEFCVNGADLRRFGSQGQQRSFVLAFKAALVRYLEERIGETPILLLDDIGSELDNQRKESFFNYLLDRGGQVFVSTTEPRTLLTAGLPEACYFRVEEGRVFPEQRLPR